MGNNIKQENIPLSYKNCGSAIVLNEKFMPYPRVCAHRGFSFAAPENTLPAYGAAIGMGADEIEFDLWPTKDGEIVSCHDRTLERVSDGEGYVDSKTLDELKTLDFGYKFSENFKGLPIVTFEEILKRFSGHTIMNIHIKPGDYYYDEFPRWYVEKIVSLLKKYDAIRHSYLMLEVDAQIKQFKSYAPEIPVCVGHHVDHPWEIVDRAIETGADKVQFFLQYVNREMIEKAHAHGIKCNMFFADEPEKAIEYLEMGIDTILTNNFCVVNRAVKDYLKSK